MSHPILVLLSHGNRPHPGILLIYLPLKPRHPPQLELCWKIQCRLSAEHTDRWSSPSSEEGKKNPKLSGATFFPFTSGKHPHKTSCDQNTAEEGCRWNTFNIFSFFSFAITGCVCVFSYAFICLQGLTNIQLGHTWYFINHFFLLTNLPMCSTYCRLYTIKLWLIVSSFLNSHEGGVNHICIGKSQILDNCRGVWTWSRCW